MSATAERLPERWRGRAVSLRLKQRQDVRVVEQDVTGAARGGKGNAAARALKVLLFLILVALVLVLVALQQRALGGYGAEMSADNADEASHFISGLMIADYLRSGLSQHPLAFATDYYLHLPKVAIGHWPPLYYLAEAGLFLALPPTTPVALLLPALLAALLVVTTGWVAARALGPLQGVAVGVVLLAAPLLRQAMLVIQLDLPVAFLALLATLAYARFLRTQRVGPAALFGLIASIAILTKGTAAALALLPPLVVLLGGRFRLMLRWGFWVPLPIVLVLAGPWTVMTAKMAANGFQYEAGVDFIDLAIATYADGLSAALGGLLLLLAGVGMLLAVVRSWRGRAQADLWVALVALAVAFFVFHCLMPSGLDPRYMLPVVAPLILLAAYGATGLLGMLTTGWPTLKGLVAALVLLIGALPALMTPVEKRPIGMGAAAEAFLAGRPDNPLVLVGSDAMGEGAFISTIGQQDRARRIIVLRGTKMLARTDWNATSYRPLAKDAADLLRQLDAVGVGHVVVDTSAAAQALPHDRQLEEAIAAFPERFRLIASYPRADARGEVRLYELTGNGDRTPDMKDLAARIMADKAN